MRYSHKSIYYLHYIKESLIAELEFEIHKVYIKEVLPTMDISFSTLVPTKIIFMNIFFIRINFHTNNRNDRDIMGNISSIRFKLNMDYMYNKKSIILQNPINIPLYFYNNIEANQSKNKITVKHIIRKILNKFIEKSLLDYHISVLTDANVDYINENHNKINNKLKINKINTEVQFRSMSKEMLLQPSYSDNDLDYNLSFNNIATNTLDTIIQTLNNLHLCNHVLDKYLKSEINKEMQLLKQLNIK